MYGWRGRVGSINPSRGDTLMYEFYKAAPEGVMIVPTALGVTAVRADQLNAILDRYEAAVREMVRVLRPGGRFVCLELTPYRRPVLGRLFAWHFGRLVPLAGGLLSGDREAYRYLPASVAAFPPAADLAVLMRRAGLTDVTYRLVGLGTVAIHWGETRVVSGE